MTKTRQEPEGFSDFWHEGDSLPSHEFLIEAYTYDPDTGQLWWNSRPHHHFTRGNCLTIEAAAKKWNSRYAGTLAAHDHGNGYKRTSLYKRGIYVHRIAWKIIFNEEPKIIDHLNGDRSDNRVSNLRSCSQRDNTRNQTRDPDGGVYKCQHFGWYGQVSTDAGVKSKLFKTRPEALAWRRAEAVKHGYTERHVGVSQ